MVDKNKVDKLIEESTINLSLFEDLVNSILEYNCLELDNLMEDIKNDVVLVEEPALITVEKYFLELTNMIFFLGDKLEKVGLKASVAKQLYQTKYNEAYLKYQVEKIDGKAPTVNVITAKAENEVLEESLTSEAYQKAYSIFKTKLSNANTMISSLSKVLSRRMSENNLIEVESSKRLLNE